MGTCRDAVYPELETPGPLGLNDYAEELARYGPLEREQWLHSVVVAPGKVEVHVWDPVGSGSSSFGHLSVAINGLIYSYAPGGMTIDLQGTYVVRNQQFRGADIYELELSLEEIDLLVRSLDKVSKAYSPVTHNCADPLESALESLGYDLGTNVTPRQLADSLNEQGLIRSVRRIASWNPYEEPWVPWAWGKHE